MLIRYSIENFRSFHRVSGLLMAAGTQRTLDENLIRKDGGRFLPSAIVYGANASGKSNIILSIDIMKEIVLHGGIGIRTPILDRLELYPFAHKCSGEPMVFDIDFIAADMRRYQYTIAIAVKTKDNAVNRTIMAETLKMVAGKKVIPLFHRDSNSICFNKSQKAIKLMESNEKILTMVERQMSQNLDPMQLCLTGGFKSIVNFQIANQILGFYNKLMIASEFQKEKGESFFEEKALHGEALAEWNRTIECFLQKTDFGPQQIYYEAQENLSLKLCSSYQIENSLVVAPSPWMESHGTLKLIDFIIPFKRLFLEGGVFVLDEFDTALHPQVVKDILALFHNQRVNLAGAQMIFTTFNPAYLDHNFLRRDQIWFVEKDKITYESRLYSLADFGSEKVRNDHNYLKNYLSGNYGAVPDSNFFNVTTEMVSEAI